jgi:hypothetical protein
MRKRILVEELRLPQRILDVNALHHRKLFRERTTAISTDFRYPALANLEADRYCLRLRFHQGEWLRVLLQWTACHIRQGRRADRRVFRPWALCPFCRRRSGKLYLGRNFIACRKCCKLHYLSQSQSPRARHCLQLAKLRLRVGGKPRIADGPLPKRPPRMPRKIYARLKARAEWLQYDLSHCRRRRYWQWKKPNYDLMGPKS